jgi:hypothetical protein
METTEMHKDPRWGQPHMRTVKILEVLVEVLPEEYVQLQQGKWWTVHRYRYRCPGAKRAAVAEATCNHMDHEEGLYSCEYRDGSVCLGHVEDLEVDMLKKGTLEKETMWFDRGIRPWVKED